MKDIMISPIHVLHQNNMKSTIIGVLMEREHFIPIL